MNKKPRDPTLQEVKTKNFDMQILIYLQSAKELADSRKLFYKSYMEYVSKLNDIEAKKKVDYMENVTYLNM